MRALRRRDWRLIGLGLTLVLVLAGGLLFRPVDTAAGAEPADRLRQAFEQGVAQLQAGRHDLALAHLDRAVLLSPELPEAQVNRGYALVGLGRLAEAQAAFERAIELRPGQANAYYGLALCHEAAGDLDLATGAMRSYLHLARDERPEHLGRARAALWEWEQARRPR